MKYIIYLVAIILLVLSSCTAPSDSEQSAIKGIDTVIVAEHIKALSSDDFFGRKPFTEGETKTVSYLESAFRRLGLAPGNGNRYTQDVPMVSISGNPSPSLDVGGGHTALSLKVKDEFVAYTERVTPSVSLKNSELVFAGYGVVAPEYEWNDYEGIDVRGKTVIVLVNDPGFASGDDQFFKGETMTYYGRWTYKYEEAARQGAAGVFIVHETVPAGYPWLVVGNSWSGAQLNLDGTRGPLCEVQGWLTRDAVIKIFEMSGVDMKDFSRKARSRDFKAVSLGLTATVSVENEIKRDVSKNVVAQITGTTRPDEAIVYTAHWDHLGVGQVVDGDSIYNGAMDNASGTAVMLGIAERMIREGIRPERSIVFLAVTAEEQGLLGSKYYAENPTFPPEKMIANLNIDGASYFGPMKDLTVIGYGQSELDDLAKQVAESQGRYVKPDPDAGKGYFFRSDHFNFAKIGVPALYASADYEAVDGGVELIETMKTKYLNERYHRPADEFEAVPWRFGGLYQDGNLYYEVGLRLANSEVFPRWKEGSEFKNLRE